MEIEGFDHLRDSSSGTPWSSKAARSPRGWWTADIRMTFTNNAQTETTS
jgi:hypothetical protein